MGQTISITKHNAHKTHRFTDKMYNKLYRKIEENTATFYEQYFIDAMYPVFESRLNIPIYFCIYIHNGYCIIARRLDKKNYIEVKRIRYYDTDSYTKFTERYAKLTKNKIIKI